MDWHKLADKSLEGLCISRDEAKAVLNAPDSDLEKLIDAAYIVRRHFYDNKVKIHVLCNAKSGLCSEDCAFCSQSSISKASISKYRMMNVDEVVRRAQCAAEIKAYKFCIVTSTRSPSNSELDIICEAAKRIKSGFNIKVCASLGAVTEKMAVKLKEAGLDKFNHNVETSKEHFPKVCTTHNYEDRVNTVEIVKKAGIGTCSGLVAGMGESDDDLIAIAMELRRLDVDSIPVNFLNPICGTLLQNYKSLTPARCLKILALFRFLNPAKDIRVAGGREVNLKSLQPKALYVANSIFTEGYLTTPGRSFDEDYKMITEAGFEIYS